jgi:intracellular septation protein
MKFFLDFFPIVIFVAVYAFSAEEQPMYPAVIALMIATLVQNIGTKLLTGKFEKLHLWTLGITLVAGSLTLIFRDPAFIFWKASVLVWVTAIVFLYRQHVMGKILLEDMLSKALDEPIDAPRQLWSKLNHVWAISYILFGFLNLYIAYNFSEPFWVKFKLFGLMGLNILLLGYIMTKIFKYLPVEEEQSTGSVKNAGQEMLSNNQPNTQTEATIESEKN